MKRIGIDARFWGEAGPGRYVANLVKELEKIDKKNRYFIFLSQKGYQQYQPKNKNFRKILANYRWYSFSEQLKYPRLLHRYKLDLLHFSQFNLPFLYRRPFTVTIHDMILHDYPIKKGGVKNRLLYPVKRLGYLALFWWATKKSQAIVVPSEDAKKDLIGRLGTPPQKIAVTREGFDTSLMTAPAPIAKRYQVKEPFILFVGSMYPHKNLDRLLQAYQLLRKRFQRERQKPPFLTLLGKESYFSKQRKKEAEKLGIRRFVCFPGEFAPQGYVPDEDLPAFYQHAELFVFPSLKEGFGIPPLEAMAMRLPVVASQASCIPEICGEGAIYFNPLNPREMANKMFLGLTDRSLRKKLIQAGLENAKRFSWNEMAKQTLQVWEEALKKCQK